MIDFHLHLHYYALHSVEDLIRHLDNTGCEKGVLLPIENPDGNVGVDCGSEEVLEAAEKYPDRLIPFCHVDVKQTGSLKRLEKLYSAGARGFGEHKLGIPVDHPRALEVFSLCGELNLPVLMHFQDSDGGFNTGFENFEQVLKEFPDTIFIGHAQTFWANISKEVPENNFYPDGPVVQTGLTDRLLSEYDNLYAEFSAGSGLNALQRDKEFAEDFISRHRDKLMWATDCGCNDGRGGGWEKNYCFSQRSLPLLREFASSPDHYEDIVNNNAVKLLGLE